VSYAIEMIYFIINRLVMVIMVIMMIC